MPKFRFPPRARRAGALALALAACGLAGCNNPDTVRVGYKPAGRDLARADLNPDRLADYLARSELATQGLVRDAGAAISAGRAYRRRTKDQRMRDTLATVYLDRDNQLHVVTMRDETCPACKGTGTREVPFEALDKLRVDFRCRACDGRKSLPNHVVERKYILTAEDYRDARDARAHIQEVYFGDAPAETERYVAAVASADPRAALAACVWLDRHWIREGVPFAKYKPLLDLARSTDASEAKQLMVWQFWAGRNVPGEEARAYYRIYADMKNGRVSRKGFFPAAN